MQLVKGWNLRIEVRRLRVKGWDVLYMISELFVIGAGCIDVVQCR